MKLVYCLTAMNVFSINQSYSQGASPVTVNKSAIDDLNLKAIYNGPFKDIESVVSGSPDIVGVKIGMKADDIFDYLKKNGYDTTKYDGRKVSYRVSSYDGDHVVSSLITYADSFSSTKDGDYRDYIHTSLSTPYTNNISTKVERDMSWKDINKSPMFSDIKKSIYDKFGEPSCYNWKQVPVWVWKHGQLAKINDESECLLYPEESGTHGIPSDAISLVVHYRFQDPDQKILASINFVMDSSIVGVVDKSELKKEGAEIQDYVNNNIKKPDVSAPKL